LAGPPAAFLGAADQVEQLVADGGRYLVEAQQRGDVLDLQATVAGLDPTDLAG
jgi:hypothetical protein